MDVEIINVWEPQYKGLKKNNVLAPLTASYLAAQLPSDVNVTVRNEQVRPVDYDIDVDLIALTYMIPNAIHAYEIADRFRSRGTPVIVGGFHASLLPEEALKHADAVVVGEAEDVLPELIEDFKCGSLKQIYQSTKLHSLKGLPVPRYDLIEKDFIFNHPVQATRGCPFRCSFCSVMSFYPGLRLRPIDEVIRDITCFEGRNYIQNKMVTFMDINLVGDKRYAKELFKKMIPLKKRWWSQVSIDMAKDVKLMRLAAESGCVSTLIGIESFSQESLNNIGKPHNKISEYKNAIKTFHKYGIYVMAGLIIGFDEDTAASIRKIPDLVQELGIDLAYLQILTPFYGTQLFDQLDREKRILTKDWSLYDTLNAVYQPKNMSAEELHELYLEIWREMHSVSHTIGRIFNDFPVPVSKFPSFLWRFIDNGFFLSQNLMGRNPLVGVNGKMGTFITESKVGPQLIVGSRG
ncbi:MAG: radical SAM protein [Candidatus Scalindua sp. AMX11]|nr:MAG: radical SAM protein [Candidatus Scalindua sp.]NOG82312.1 B12-binding domain-containing radical SAM protein [Planctomycetota bacterium]RZV66650.1 MAG: B12-binding domain-containing radical SAM protein [Candidatus Scalindua sp. SCAELEC01]TDE63627.1 MAG: radical SAM protein [Candidatus Scalindua sp. AMX11]GJQ59993.1 MAG: B12-binding domain-containing radical SAM protein [Candidatus Scalindua sp.]